jgi:hypothetical protein
MSQVKIAGYLQEILTAMITSRQFQNNFNQNILSEFWYEVSNDYLSLGKSAVATLLPSGWKHFCEKAFIRHGIKQNQSQKLLATGDGFHTRCQYCATHSLESTVTKTS